VETLYSKALSENLARTRVVDITLDDDSHWLLSCTESYYGIHNRCKNFYDEFFHPYSNLEATINLLRQGILSDLWFYAGLPEAERALKLILSYYQKLADLCQSFAQQNRILQEALELITLLCTHDGVSEVIFQAAFEMLRSWHKQWSKCFIFNSKSFRKCLFALSSRLPVDACSFLASVLGQNLDFWRESNDIVSWHQKVAEECNFSASELSLLAGAEYYDGLQSTLENMHSLEQLEDIPDFSDLAVYHRELTGTFQHLKVRVYYIFYLLGSPGMLEYHEHLLWDLNRQLADLYTRISEAEALEILDSVLYELEQYKAKHMTIVLDCLTSIGKTIMQHGNLRHIRHFQKRLLGFGFSTPGNIRINQDWQLEVDKTHIKHLRFLLSLISDNLPLNKDILAFLIISLTQGGVFISDTDLFQKDVSNFLNADIRSHFIQVKHLLRLFPVFFNEIGAEGEIRDASTSLDELSHRRDRLIHFFRKQVHTESNNTHITLACRIMEYWQCLDPKVLEGLIPEDVNLYVHAPDEATIKQSEVLNSFLTEHDLSLDSMLEMSWQRLQNLFAPKEQDLYLQRLKLLCYCHYLLMDKYNLDPYDIVKFLSRYTWFDAKEQNRLRSSLVRNDYDSSIRQMLGYIGKLSAVALDPKPSQYWENIYFKRHIAAGIPSMYGVYKEPKLEAIGLIFRLENVVRRLFTRSVEQLNLNYINGKTLRRIIRILELYDYAMEQELITNDAFSTALSMLRSAQHLANLSLDQYLDMFKLLKDSVSELINEYYYRFYDNALKQLTEHSQATGITEMFAEEFYRKLLSASFLVQGLDSFITRIIEALAEMKQLFSVSDIPRVMSYDPDQLFYHLDTKNSRIENQVLLGSKGYFLKRMRQYEFPVPDGFVITTELYRQRDIINMHPDISSEFDTLLYKHLQRLEHKTGLRLGDPSRPLLISVRSGAPMSLPGAMDTFLNIGLNDEITLNLSKRKNYGWTAWDCYRRLIQSWGMAYGIPRDEFDTLMINSKKKYQVQLKTQFTDEQMRLMVEDYKAVLSAHQVFLEPDPFRQMYSAISHVLDSWNTDRAQLYRQKLHIANEWGTAVIIQRMVLGNISLDSGTGVVFTHADWSNEPGICMNGDFTLCSQGEDVVAGLVHTLPITEQQRQNSLVSTDTSLEKDFPLIYQRLYKYARHLIEDRNYPHQEIEFTFEGHYDEALYILQTRNQVIHKAPEYKVLDVEQAKPFHIGSGIGIGKGAVNGIVVISDKDIARFKDTGQALILVRPDTVPEDMELLFECQALLTSRGGVTSHAAVTATRLGLIGVVNCRDLVVDEAGSVCRIGITDLAPGDRLAIDATSGNIYLHHYPLQSVQSI